MNKMISIIIPVLNSEKYLDKCLNSIVTQSYRNFEVLLIIGECIDNSREICEKWLKTDRRIHIYDQEKERKGPGGARNQGLDIAKGEYVCFCDADDWLAPDFMDVFLKTSETYNSDLIECDYYLVNETQEGIRITEVKSSEWAIQLGHDAVERFQGAMIWKCFSKTCLWKDNDIQFSETMRIEDLPIYSLLFKLSKKPMSITNALYYYRMTEGSLSRTGNTRRVIFEEMFKQCEFVSHIFKQRGIFESNHLLLANQMEMQSFYNLKRIPELQDDEELYYREKLDITIKNCFNVDRTVFGTKFLCIGSEALISVFHNFLQRIGAQGSVLSSVSMVSFNEEICTNLHKILINEQPDCIIIDLLEESNFIHEIIDLNEHIKRWRSSCSLFHQTIVSACPKAKIVILETLINLIHINNGSAGKFKNFETISLENNLLGVYYKILHSIFSSAEYIAVPEQRLCYSEDENPFNLNSSAQAYYAIKVCDSFRSQ